MYIDKTGYIRKLLKNYYNFLSRPRWFGKSLLLSTAHSSTPSLSIKSRSVMSSSVK